MPEKNNVISVVHNLKAKGYEDVIGDWVMMSKNKPKELLSEKVTNIYDKNETTLNDSSKEKMINFDFNIKSDKDYSLVKDKVNKALVSSINKVSSAYGSGINLKVTIYVKKECNEFIKKLKN